MFHHTDTDHHIAPPRFQHINMSTTKSAVVKVPPAKAPAPKGSPVRYLTDNGELTGDAHLNDSLIAKCKFIVSDPAKLNITNKDGTSKSENDIYQRYIEVEYPSKERASSVVIPDCYMYNEVKDFYGTPSIYLGIPKNTFMRPFELALNKIGFNPAFDERNITSTDALWWIRSGMKDMDEGKELIRLVELDKHGEVESTEYYGSYAELFADLPSTLLANITCTLKLKTSVPKNQALTGNEKWRVGVNVTMYNPTEPTDVIPPQTGAVQSSQVTAKDGMSEALKKLRQRASK